jgi:DNA-binding GntR family transcriptional regulator
MATNRSVESSDAWRAYRGPEEPSADDRALKTVDVQNLGKRIAEVLRSDILFGRLRAGDRLDQTEICTRFNTSRMPVRDALAMLEHEGLLVPGPRRQVYVAELTERDIRDAFEICAFLSAMAADRASRGDEQLRILAELERLNADMHSALGAGDARAVADLNWQFHERINRTADAPQIVSALRRVSPLIPVTYMAELPESIEHSLEEHAELLNAWRRRAHREVYDVAFRHVSTAGDQFLANVQWRHEPDTPTN